MVLRPGSAPQRPRTARQRAIYSEVLLLEGKPGTQKLGGPTQGREIRGTREPRPLSANGFAQRKRHVPALTPDSSSLPKYAVIEPKVMESHRTVAGRCPRRLRVERLKKKYESQDIQKLLTERQVDVTMPWYEDMSPLPLSAFDNVDYDTRTPSEWMALAKDSETGEEKSLPALALWRDPSDGTGHWRRAVVLQYNLVGEKFEVQYEEAEPTELGGRRGMMEFLPRLRVMFRGEDPEAFANRVEEAYKSRTMADCLLRYNFYIDNMPTDDVQQLNGDQTDWLRRAVKTGRPGNVDVAELEVIMQEVQLDFARAMNKVTFDTHVLQGNADPLHESLLPYVEKGFVAQAVCKPPAPWKGRISIPRHRFSETFAKFCFTTLRVRPEVVLALQGIKAQSEARLLENIFGIDETRPLRLDEFRQNLRSSCAEAALSLKEDWPTSLQTIVLREFDSVKKGWFNVREKNVDLYRHGKLRRFLLLARLMMQDTLRNLAKMSVQSYVSTIERLAPMNVSVKSIYGAECTFRESFQNPVLTVEVRPSEGFTHFDFVLHPHRFVSTALDAYNAGLQFLNEVYPLERLMIPPRLQSSDGPSLIEAFQFDEDWVQDGYQRIQSSLENACLGPTEFLQRLQIFEPLLQRDPAALVEAFFEKDKENAEPSDQKIQEAITKEMKCQQELWWQLLEVVDVGMFQVTTKDVRKALAAKHEITHVLFMERLVRRLRIHMDETTSDMRSLMVKISKAPKNVVELVQMRNSIDTLPEVINEMQVRISKHLKLYDEIESFCHQLSPEDFRMRWELVAAPHQARKMLAQKAASLHEFEAEFVRGLLSEQDALQERLNEIEDTLQLFRSQPAYWDVSSMASARAAAESLLERIEEAQEDSVKINDTEMTLQRKQTDYSKIQKFALDFNPFYQVWAVVYAFHEDQTKFNLGAISDKDVLRRKMIQTYQVLEKTVKSLKMGNWPAPLVQLGEDHLIQMEEFQLMLLSQSSHQAHDDDAE